MTTLLDLPLELLDKVEDEGRTSMLQLRKTCSLFNIMYRRNMNNWFYMYEYKDEGFHERKEPSPEIVNNGIITNVDFNTKVPECISSLDIFKTVVLSEMEMTNEIMRQLSSCYRVSLESVDGLIDLSLLSSCHTVRLEEIHQELDVSPLASCYDVGLSLVNIPSGIDSLGTCHTVNLQRCGGMSNISSLSTCHKVTIGDYMAVKDFSPLGQCHTVTLCDWERQLPSLGTCHSVILSTCKVRSLSELSTCHTVKLYYCSRIESFSPLSTCHTVWINSCNNVDGTEKLRETCHTMSKVGELDWY